MKAVVTGGAGFIGSHIVDRLVQNNYKVVVYDNFSTGFEKFVEHHSDAVEIVRKDVLDFDSLNSAMQGAEIVFHMQANADVRGGINKNKIDLEQNVLATHNVLESMRINKVKKIAFASSATVYGEPEVFPTPETNPLIQTSTYGASKASCESFIQAFSEYYDIQSFIFRFVSFIGERYTHGVIFDFVKKLLANSKELEILGNGSQKKSYLHVGDGVNAIFTAIEKSKERKNIFNLGHSEYIQVIDLADILCKRMGLKDVEYKFTGGERGWIGDSPFVLLDTKKIQSLGWKPELAMAAGIERTVEYLMANQDLLESRK